jgi:hypothetical protein
MATNPLDLCSTDNVLPILPLLAKNTISFGRLNLAGMLTIIQPYNHHQQYSEVLKSYRRYHIL